MVNSTRGFWSPPPPSTPTPPRCGPSPEKWKQEGKAKGKERKTEPTEKIYLLRNLPAQSAPGGLPYEVPGVGVPALASPSLHVSYHPPGGGVAVQLRHRTVLFDGRAFHHDVCGDVALQCGVGSASGVDPTYIEFVMTGMYILKLSTI